MKPFATYPEDHARLLELAAKCVLSDDVDAVKLGDLVMAILSDEAAAVDDWIWWGGGEPPVPPEKLGAGRHADGEEVFDRDHLLDLSPAWWGRDDGECTPVNFIIAYRLVQP